MVERISPGDWVKAESGWRIWPLPNPDGNPGAEAGFTGSSGGVRASAGRSRNRNRAARNEKKPFRALSSNSSAVSALGESQSLGECTVATVSQHGTECSGGFPKTRTRRTKNAERRTTRAFASGKENESRPDSATLPQRRRCFKRTTAGS
jgi:hypothetical protein